MPATAEPTLYRNQSGSEMGISIDGQGSIEGFYRSALGCGQGVPRPLVGWLNQSALTFTVNFQECKSVTAWVGHLKMDGSISALWTMARGEGTGWTSKITGASEFTPVKAQTPVAKEAPVAKETPAVDQEPRSE
jgi:hypothetical protein